MAQLNTRFRRSIAQGSICLSLRAVSGGFMPYCRIGDCQLALFTYTYLADSVSLYGYTCMWR
jgi:hypothetical protein